MDLVNRTPFSPFVFETIEPDGDHYSVVVLRGTFRIENGRCLIPVQEQKPCIIADQYEQDPLTSPLVKESDLVPIKFAVDVFLTGTAIAPDEQPTTDWGVGISIGSKAKSSIQVGGRREWNFGLLTGYTLGPAEPCTSVPLSYGRAFGGTVVQEDGAESKCEENPVGIGYSTPECRKQRKTIIAPQIWVPDANTSKVNANHTPKCFAPIPKHLPQRLQFAGTYDDKWLAEKWPQYPSDFDPKFFSAAHPELQLDDDLTADDLFELQGMRPKGTLSFRIPEYQVHGEIHDEYGVSSFPLHLDTVDINIDAAEVGLVWRGRDLRLSPAESIELSMTGEGVRYA